MSEPVLSKTPLHDWHASHNGRMIDFAGWSMPVHYGSIVAEHVATRQAATLFDVSHMGRLRFDGAAAADFLDPLLTRRVTSLKPGQIRYGLMTNEQGGMLDDVLVYHLADHDGRLFHWLVVNAGNRQKILAWLKPHLAEVGDVRMTDLTHDTAMIAVQGPKAIDLVDQLSDVSLIDMPYYNGAACQISRMKAFVSRTGYTGEDGCEIVVPADTASKVWNRLMETGASHGVMAAGLGARDTLRLEAAMPLYGQELSESINPFQARLGFAVHLKNHEFIGRDALLKLKSNSELPVRIGLRLDGKRPARQHYPVFAAEGPEPPIGEVTSGGFSPTMQCPIAMAYVLPTHAAVGTKLKIEIRGSHHSATVVELPFYEREKVGEKDG